MSRTLFTCGLRKSLELKDGKLYDITETLEKTVELNRTTVKCEHCSKSFKAQQYMDSYVQFKHPTFAKHCKQNSNRQSSESTNGSTIVVDANTENTEMMDGGLQNGNAPCDSTNRSQSRNNNQRRTNIRRSHTVEFKKKTLDLLDSMKTSRYKYQTVAKQQGVYRSLVFKWEKKQKQNYCRTDSE